MPKCIPRAILFDLDDTIIAFTEGAEPTWRLIAERFSKKLPGVTADSLFDALNRSRSTFWEDPDRHREGRMDPIATRRRITASALSSLDCSDETLSVEMADSYDALREQTLRLFPGAIETLTHLQSIGVRMALITNGAAATQRAKIDLFDLARFFDCIFIEGEFGVGKPDDRVYLHALDRLGVAPRDAWMVGDNLEWDVAAPQKLGLTVVWVDYAGAGLPESSDVQPDRIVSGVSEIFVA